MNAPYSVVNAMAARICRINPIKPVKRIYQGETVDITFLGLDLVAEIDYEGFVEGIKSPDGSDLYSAFAEWAITDISNLVEKAIKQAKFDSEMDRAEERFNDKEAS